MRMVIVGAQGQVGSELTRRAPGLGYEVLAWDQAELDITNAAAVDQALNASGAEVVINAAAYTAVVQAEQQPALAFAVNRDGPAHLAAACDRLNIPLLHISTDYVYDGRKTSPYVEEDSTGPLGVYGASKLAGDEAAGRLLPRHLILRVSWVFGIYGQNFVKTILRLARERDELRIVADQCGGPTYAGDIADLLLNLARRIAEIDADNAWGIYHYCGQPATTWHGFATAIVEAARHDRTFRVNTILPITTADYPTPAARPAHSVLDCGKLIARFGIQPRLWREGLQTMLLASL